MLILILGTNDEFYSQTEKLCISKNQARLIELINRMHRSDVGLRLMLTSDILSYSILYFMLGWTLFTHKLHICDITLIPLSVFVLCEWLHQGTSCIRQQSDHWEMLALRGSLLIMQYSERVWRLWAINTKCYQSDTNCQL